MHIFLQIYLLFESIVLYYGIINTRVTNKKDILTKGDLKKMKNKLKYERPEITLIQWTTDDDIITTSGDGDLGDWDTDM